VTVTFEVAADQVRLLAIVLDDQDASRHGAEVSRPFL
jgi:hypothetical protein